MNQLTDEILNEYLEGNLSIQEMKEVETLLASSETDSKRFAALKLVHHELSHLKEFETSKDFTQLVVSKLNKKFKLPRQQNFFVVMVVSVFILICIGIVGYTAASIISSSSTQTDSIQIAENVEQVSRVLINEIKNIFSSKNLSFIGLIFSLGVLISAYFFFENQKQRKVNLFI